MLINDGYLYFEVLLWSVTNNIYQYCKRQSKTTMQYNFTFLITKFVKLLFFVICMIATEIVEPCHLRVSCHNRRFYAYSWQRTYIRFEVSICISIRPESFILYVKCNSPNWGYMSSAIPPTGASELSKWPQQVLPVKVGFARAYCLLWFCNVYTSCVWRRLIASVE